MESPGRGRRPCTTDSPHRRNGSLAGRLAPGIERSSSPSLRRTSLGPQSLPVNPVGTDVSETATFYSEDAEAARKVLSPSSHSSNSYTLGACACACVLGYLWCSTHGACALVSAARSMHDHELEVWRCGECPWARS
jgi:hypothetical protein